MVSVQEAFAILENNPPPLQETSCSLIQAHQHTLAEEVFSPLNMPPFRQSAMDGYALCLSDALDYEIIGEIKAGDSHLVSLSPGQAVKIFTGAAVPDSAQAVIQIEKVLEKNGRLYLQEPVKVGTNVRPIGEQISEGALALEKGTVLNAAAIGFLAGLGFTKVSVYNKPKIAIVVTGSELLKPGTNLAFGKVYESNGIMLKSALKEAGFEAVTLYEVNDNFENTKNSLEEALSVNDVVLVSGGISVGDYDFVAQALQELQVTTLFHQVSQKPGKPLFAGKLQNKMIFALPGNPAAALTCFYVYVLPSLSILSGQAIHYNQTKTITLAHDYSVKNTRSQFLKASVTNEEVVILSHQASSMLNSFAVSNALVFLPDGNYDLQKGGKVDVYLL